MSKEYFCGPFWMPKFIRRIVSCPFNSACELHDLMYESKYVSRHDADYIFLDNMLKIARGRFIVELYACTLFIAVRIGGKISWKKSEE